MSILHNQYHLHAMDELLRLYQHLIPHFCDLRYHIFSLEIGPNLRPRANDVGLVTLSTHSCSIFRHGLIVHVIYYPYQDTYVHGLLLPYSVAVARPVNEH